MLRLQTCLHIVAVFHSNSFFVPKEERWKPMLGKNLWCFVESDTDRTSLLTSDGVCGKPRSASEGRLQLDGGFLKNEAMSLF